MRDTAREARRNRIDRVAGARHEYHIAPIHESQRDVADAFLRADQCQDLGGGVQPNSEPPLVPGSHRSTEREEAFIGWILVVLRVGCRLLQPFDDRRWRRQVRVADPEVDDIHPTGESLLLDLVDRSEQIRRQGLDPPSRLYRKSGHSRSFPTALTSNSTWISEALRLLQKEGRNQREGVGPVTSGETRPHRPAKTESCKGLRLCGPSSR